MWRSGLALSCVVLLGTGVPAARGSSDPDLSQALVRSVYVSAHDGKGTPVTDLVGADFLVKEDGKAREVVKAELATAAMQIALLVDDNGLGVNDIRNGAAGFIQRLQGRAEIAVVSTAGQNVTRVDYTTSIAAQIAGVSQLLTRPGPLGGHLLEAIFDAARGLEARQAPRPVIVVVAFEGEEYSNLRQDRVLDQLRRSGASLHVLAIGRPVARTMNPRTEGPQSAPLDENFNRSKVLGDGPKQSGGRREEMVVSAGIPKALQQIADDLTSQYLVSYSLPAGVKPSEKLGVSISRPGVTVRAPTRVPDRQRP